MIEWMVVGLLIFRRWPYPSSWHVSDWLLSGETHSFDERVRSLRWPHPSYAYNAETFQPVSDAKSWQWVELPSKLNRETCLLEKVDFMLHMQRTKDSM